MGLRVRPGADVIQIQESELVAAKWADMDELVNERFYDNRPLYK